MDCRPSGTPLVMYSSTVVFVSQHLFYLVDYNYDRGFNVYPAQNCIVLLTDWLTRVLTDSWVPLSSICLLEQALGTV